MTESEKSRIWVAEQWWTVQVTALPPGWYNRYDGDTEDDPCPAVLLQEHRSSDHYEDTDGSGTVRRRREYHEPPFETRVVFADPNAYADGYLDDAHAMDSYLLTYYRD